MELIKSEILFEGYAIIDIYCASGDINDSFVIVPANKYIDDNGEEIYEFDSLPDASYGVDYAHQENERTIDDYDVFYLRHVEKYYDNNGWTVREVIVETEEGRILVRNSH